MLLKEFALTVTIEVPKSLFQKAVERNIDVEKFIIESLIQKLDLDPKEEASIHAELAEKFFREGKNLIKKDPIQASEKLYKAVEESIKALTVAENLSDILGDVKARGRWTVTDLDKAARRLARKFGNFILQALDQAWTLHVWGFHEGKLCSESILVRIPAIEKLVNYVSRLKIE